MSGNAFEDVVSIHITSIPETVANVTYDIRRVLDIKPKCVVPCGSVGLGDVSGDIDIIVEFASKDDIQHSNILESLMEIDPMVKTLPSGGFTFRYPIYNMNGTVSIQQVQVDVFVTDNLKLMQFLKHAPSPFESNYKAVYRSILLNSISRYVDLRILKAIEGQPVTWSRLLLDWSRGLMRVTQTIEGKTKLLSRHKTIYRELISGDPEEIIEALLGPMVTMNDVNSFESLYEFITSSRFKYKRNLEQILIHFKQSLKNNDIEIPKELK